MCLEEEDTEGEKEGESGSEGDDGSERILTSVYPVVAVVFFIWSRE